MKTFPAPNPLIGDNLQKEIESALTLPANSVRVSLSDKEVQVTGVDSHADDDIAVIVSKHTGQLTPDQLAVHAAAQEIEEVSQSLQSLVGKAKSIKDGNGSFTPQEIQKILAALVLRAMR